MPSIQGYQIDGLSTSGILMPMLSNKYSVSFYFQKPVMAVIDNQDYLSMQCVNFDRPHLTFEKAEIHRYNAPTVKVPTRGSWGDVNITVQLDIGGRAANIIQAQMNAQQSIMSATGGNSTFPTAAGANYYKFHCELRQYDGMYDTPIELWELEGCWIQSYNPGQNNYESTTPLNANIIMSIDNAQQIIQGNLTDDTAIDGFSV